jgi:hypothetical protein
MIYDPENARRLYAPSLGSLISHLPDLGEALHAAVDQSHVCTLERIDMMLARLKGAETSLIHLRRKLMQS